MRPLVVAIHGILTRTTSPSWPDDLDAALPCKVMKRDYRALFISVFNVFVRNPRIAKGLAAEIALHRDVAIHFVAHSNGCDIALRTAKELIARGIPVASLLLVSSVTDEDVERTGILRLVRSGMLGQAIAYSSRRDLPLRLPFKWPYRSLGIHGWLLRGKKFGSDKIFTRRFDVWGHGDFFSATNRATTFRFIKRDLGFPVQLRDIAQIVKPANEVR